MDAGYWNESQAAARACGADTGRAGRYAARHAADRQQLGDWPHGAGSRYASRACGGAALRCDRAYLWCEAEWLPAVPAAVDRLQHGLRRGPARAAGLAAGARPGAGGAARHDIQSDLQHLPALRATARVLYRRHSAVRAGIRLAAGPGRRKGSPVAAGCRDPLCPAAVGAGRNCAVCPERRKYPAAGHPPVLSRRRSAPRPLPDPAARAVRGRGLRVFGVEAVTKLLPPHQSA